MDCVASAWTLLPVRLKNTQPALARRCQENGSWINARDSSSVWQCPHASRFTAPMVKSRRMQLARLSGSEIGALTLSAKYPSTRWMSMWLNFVQFPIACVRSRTCDLQQEGHSAPPRRQERIQESICVCVSVDAHQVSCIISVQTC